MFLKYYFGSILSASQYKGTQETGDGLEEHYCAGTGQEGDAPVVSALCLPIPFGQCSIVEVVSFHPCGTPPRNEYRYDYIVGTLTPSRAYTMVEIGLGATSLCRWTPGTFFRVLKTIAWYMRST